MKGKCIPSPLESVLEQVWTTWMICAVSTGNTMTVLSFVAQNTSYALRDGFEYIELPRAVATIHCIALRRFVVVQVLFAARLERPL